MASPRVVTAWRIPGEARVPVTVRAAGQARGAADAISPCALTLPEVAAAGGRPPRCDIVVGLPSGSARLIGARVRSSAAVVELSVLKPQADPLPDDPAAVLGLSFQYVGTVRGAVVADDGMQAAAWAAKAGPGGAPGAGASAVKLRLLRPAAEGTVDVALIELIVVEAPELAAASKASAAASTQAALQLMMSLGRAGGTIPRQAMHVMHAAARTAGAGPGPPALPPHSSGAARPGAPAAAPTAPAASAGSSTGRGGGGGAGAGSAASRGAEPPASEALLERVASLLAASEERVLARLSRVEGRLATLETEVARLGGRPVAE